MPADQESRSLSTPTFRFTLPFAPLLESWDGREHPSQRRLAAYREAVAGLGASALEQLEPPLALGFHVAGRPDIASGCDLDNFLTPVVKALGGGTRFSLVWATRGRATEPASLTLYACQSVPPPMPDSSRHVSARISVSTDRPEWKVALASAVGNHDSARRNGQVDLRLRFELSPQRNWVALWKPAIDALGGILGEGRRPWHPRDDRISRLVLERVLRTDIGWDVIVDVYWSDS
jgi:hypothetical protein